MKTIVLGSILALFAIIATAPAFADHSNVDVSIVSGSSSPGCEETDECYTPSEMTIDVGSEVTWTNDDSASHTVTSGDPKKGLDGDGLFNSRLFYAGKSFSHKFDEAGEYSYFCQVHTWMKGTVIVQAAHTDEHSVPDAMVMTQDGSMMAHISTETPEQGKEVIVSVEFTDPNEDPVEHVNFEVTATQDGKQVLSAMGQHAHSGITEMTTSVLESDHPLDVQVKILGIGLPTDDPATWTGPKGETVSASVVPEFGPLAMIILASAIIGTIAYSARSRVIPRL
ncbi:MAG: plastocyanin/azurin family copper-binding protein [Candidatus Nitrosotenuis sp.]